RFRAFARALAGALSACASTGIFHGNLRGWGRPALGRHTRDDEAARVIVTTAVARRRRQSWRGSNGSAVETPAGAESGGRPHRTKRDQRSAKEPSPPS